MSVNTDALINEVTTVLKMGLDKLLADYKDKYDLYEETHKCVVTLHNLLSKAPIPSPQDDARYDKLEKQIEHMKDEIALLKGKPICDLVQPSGMTGPSGMTDPSGMTGPTVKTEIKTESSDKESKDVQTTEEKENITLIIEPVREEESEEESEEEESEDEESEQEELSDEDEETKAEPEKPATATAALATAAPDDEEELFEIEIDDVSYCTNDEDNGVIYELTADGDVGAKVGYLKDGEPIFE
jgi:hypothetical protein